MLLKDRVELRAHLDHAADLETTVVAHLLDPLAALRVQQRAQLGPDTGGMEARVAGGLRLEGIEPRVWGQQWSAHLGEVVMCGCPLRDPSLCVLGRAAAGPVQGDGLHSRRIDSVRGHTRAQAVEEVGPAACMGQSRGTHAGVRPPRLPVAGASKARWPFSGSACGCGALRRWLVRQTRCAWLTLRRRFRPLCLPRALQQAGGRGQRW